MQAHDQCVELFCNRPALRQHAQQEIGELIRIW